MIRLYNKRKKLIESSGKIYKYHFFDLVFEKMRKERYSEIFEKGDDELMEESVSRGE